MPLVDHFHPPLSERRQWHSFHSVWAPMIALDLSLQAWHQALALGDPLPTLPFWLKNGPCIKLDLDDTYMRTLQEQRMLTTGARTAIGPGS